jgi:hypothetical protein
MTKPAPAIGRTKTGGGDPFEAWWNVFEGQIA